MTPDLSELNNRLRPIITALAAARDRSEDLDRGQDQPRYIEDLTLRLAGAVSTYVAISATSKEGIFKPQTPMQRAKALRKFATSLEKAKGAWSELDQDALAQVTEEYYPVSKIAATGENDFLFLMTDKLYGIETAARAAADVFEAQGARHGRHEAPAIRMLAKTISDVYIVATGNKPTRTYNAITDEVSGPFVTFLNQFLNVSDLDVSRDTLLKLCTTQKEP